MGGKGVGRITAGAGKETVVPVGVSRWICLPAYQAVTTQFGAGVDKVT
jgi:hypothetical protein